MVSAISQRNEVVVQVRDPGAGIDPDIKGRLFEKFASKSSGGTGLGLYLSRRIIEAHGGRIWCRDSEVAKGTDCGFAIPLDLRQEGIAIVEKDLDEINVR